MPVHSRLFDRLRRVRGGVSLRRVSSGGNCCGALRAGVGVPGSSFICSGFCRRFWGCRWRLHGAACIGQCCFVRLRRSARVGRQRFRRRFWNIRQARAMDVPFLFAWRQSPGVSARCFITRPMRRFCPATASRARQSCARQARTIWERDEYYASRGVWMCASAKGKLTVEAGTRSLRYFPVYAAERLKRVCTQIFPAGRRWLSAGASDGR